MTEAEQILFDAIIASRAAFWREEDKGLLMAWVRGEVWLRWNLGDMGDPERSDAYAKAVERHLKLGRHLRLTPAARTMTNTVGETGRLNRPAGVTGEDIAARASDDRPKPWLA